MYGIIATFLASFEERDSVEEWSQEGEEGGVLGQLQKRCW